MSETNETRSPETATSQSYAQPDFDALERTLKAKQAYYGSPNPAANLEVAIGTLHALIQRLRQQEAAITEAGLLVGAIKADLDRARHESHRDLMAIKATTERREARIALLERVREAAEQLNGLEVPTRYREDVSRLMAALDAANSESKAQSETSSTNSADTAPKAG